MQNAEWITLLRQIPQALQNKVSLVLQNRSDISVDSIMRLEPSFVVLRGRLGGTTEGDGSGRCDLVLDNGQVTGEVETASARYRIVPVGPGPTHAVVEVRTEAFPNEHEPKRQS